MNNSNIKILIIDDHVANIKLMTEILKNHYQIIATTNATAAFDLIKQHPDIKLILLDIILPEMNGYEICRQIKNTEATKDIPIIFVTSLNSEEEEAKGLEAGAVDYITKPIRPSIMRARVKTHLELSKLFNNSKNLLMDTSDQLIKQFITRVNLEEQQQRFQKLKTIIMQLFETSLQNLTIHEQLNISLDIINLVTGLTQPKGAIFLADADQNLVLMGHNNMPELLQKCPQLELIDCPLKRAAQTGKIIYNPSTDETQGNYVLPLMTENRLIGILVFYVSNDYQPFKDEELLIDELSKVFAEIISHRLLNAKLQVSHFELEKNQEEIIRRLGMAAEFRDNETGMHIARMSHYAKIIAASIGLSKEDQKMLLLTAPMHDVGKIGIPDSILFKTGRLNEEEFNLIKTHTIIGGRILVGYNKILSTARTIALSHHEKWDGTGYPNNLAGENIPIFGRICALADVFDALTMERSYKKAWSVEDAVNFIKNQSGTHFDPNLVQAFLKSLPEILLIKAAYPDNKESNFNSIFLPPMQVIKENSPLWTDEYCIGIESIDDQHRTLFYLVDHLEKVIQKRQAVLEICKALKQLESYVFTHFAEEEKFMLDNKYENYKLHKEKHLFFEQKIENFWENVRENSLLTGTKIINFLNGWLVEHIVYEDMKLKNIVVNNFDTYLELR